MKIVYSHFIRPVVVLFVCTLCPLVCGLTHPRTHTNGLYLCSTISASFLLNQSCFLLAFCPGSSCHCVGHPTVSMFALPLVVCVGNGACNHNSNIATTAVYYVGTDVTSAQHNITYIQMFVWQNIQPVLRPAHVHFRNKLKWKTWN